MGDNRVLIVGAGAAGLLIAQVLKRENVSCTVYEQDITFRPRDWNYGVYWAQSSLSGCLPQHLIDQLEGCQVDSHKPAATDILPGFNGASGERLVDVPAPFSLRLKRRKFLSLIEDGLDVQRGKRLTGITTTSTTVTATFADTTTATGTLLIGAEGAHSLVREYLLGYDAAALKPSPVVSSICTPRLPLDVQHAVRQLHPRYCAVFHPEGYFCWVGMHNEAQDARENEFLVLMSWVEEKDTGLAENEAVLADLKKKGSHFAQPFRSVFESLSTGTKVWHSRLSYWATQPWDNCNGTVTLAGDAAHPMTFHRGQGLNNAILDAAFLSQEIAKLSDKSPASLRSAFQAYEEEVCRRGREAVESSNINSLSIHNWGALQNSPLFKMGLKKDSS